MTNPSHTELAAQARKAANALEILDLDSTTDLLRQCAAALESPEREVQWLRWAEQRNRQTPVYGRTRMVSGDALAQLAVDAERLAERLRALANSAC